MLVNLERENHRTNMQDSANRFLSFSRLATDAAKAARVEDVAANG